MRRLRRLFAIYGPFVTVELQQFLAYPARFLLNGVASTIYLLAWLFIWRITAAHDPASTPGGGNDYVLYYLAGFCIFDLTSLDAIRYVGSDIRSGDVALALIRPVSYHGRVFASCLGRSWAGSLWDKVPLLLGIIVYKCLWLDQLSVLANLPLFAVSFTLAALLNFSIHFLVGMMAFFTENIWGLGLFFFSFTLLFSGTAIPLGAMPPRLRAVVECLPFASLAHAPATVLLALPQDSAAQWRLLALQTVWLLVFGGALHYLWPRTVRRLWVAGG